MELEEHWARERRICKSWDLSVITTQAETEKNEKKNKASIPCDSDSVNNSNVGNFKGQKKYQRKSSLQFSRSVVSDSLWPRGLQHAWPPCPSLTPRVHSNSCPSSQWKHPTISSSVVPFSSRLQSFPATGSFPKSRFFTSGGQSIGVSASASIPAVNIQDWFPLGWTGWISLQSMGLSGVFSNTTVQKHQFFGTQLSLWSNSYIHTWLEKP